ncbi:peptide ABC transporter substrate-binding protein [Candidatus Halobeggiatoa sp. HSG11]|nr:peptide ABC transporter substrate-binding protein [Candidatus Halobeggiatoa sp. HSG11]
MNFIYFKLIVTTLFFMISYCEANDNKSQIQNTKHETIRIALGQNVNTIDPSLARQEQDFEIIEQLFLGLTDFEPTTYNVIPEFAISWKVNDDNTIYTFKLRQDVKWTNGEPVTAHDVVWTINHNLIQSPRLYKMLYIIKNAKAIRKGELLPLGVNAIDDYTVEFELEYAAGYFPAMVSMSVYRPLPKNVVKKYGNDWTKLEHIQTNGSYYPINWKQGKSITLEKNLQYYDVHQVQIQKIQYFIISNAVLGFAMYKHDELDIIGGNSTLPRDEMPYINFNANLRRELHNTKKFKTLFYGFNTKNPPMDNKLVRKAISAAINKQIINDFVVWNNNTIANTFTHPSTFGSVEPQQQVGVQFDPKQAKKWLLQAGYNDNEFPKDVVLISPDEPTKLSIANAIKIMLKRYLNIDIKIQKYGRRDDKKTFDIHIFYHTWTGDYPDANNWLYETFHPKFGYYSKKLGWSNDEFTEVVEKAQQITEQTERKRLYHRAEQIITEEEAAIIPIYFTNAPILVKSRVKGWYHMPFGGQHIRDWKLEN